MGKAEKPTAEKPTTERPTNIRAKLAYIQQRLRVNKDRGKGHDDRAGVTYEFRNAEDILEKVKPLAEEVKALVVLDVKPEVIGPQVPVDVRSVQSKTDQYNTKTETFVAISGPRFAAVATAYLLDCETTDEVHATSFAFIDPWRKGQTEPEKLCGSADSYASKYALGHLFALDNNRDADMESNERQPEPQPKPQPKKPLPAGATPTGSGYSF